MDLDDFCDEFNIACVTQAPVTQNVNELGMDPEILSEFLMENGALSVVIQDANKGTKLEQPIFNQPSSDGEGWYREGASAVGDNVWRR